MQKQDLLGQIKTAGLERPSDDLLARLAREGLLPRPRQRHPGRVRGSIAEYPERAVPQAIGVLRLHVEVHRFDNLRFWAFWEGLWVESRVLRRTLSKWIKSATPTVDRPVGDPFDLAESLAFETESTTPIPGLTPTQEQDVRSTAFATLLGAMGGDPGWESTSVQVTTREDLDKTPTELINETLRPEALMADVGEFGPLVDEAPDLRTLFASMASTGFAMPGWWAESIRTIPLGQLHGARDTARVLSDVATFADALALHLPSITIPSSFVKPLRGPSGRDAGAIRHKAKLLGMGLMLNQLPSQEVVTENLQAFENAIAKVPT